MNVVGDNAIVGLFRQVLAEVRDVVKSEVATVPTKAGGSYSYRYASLGSVLDECKRACATKDLALTQVLTRDGDLFAVATTVIGSDGSRIEFPPAVLRMPGDAQALGGAATYLRRYSLVSIFGMATEDDDGKEASEQARNASQYEGKRTAQELAIHQILAVVGADAAREVVADFRAHFGHGLSDLATTRHPEALLWVIERVAMTAPEEQDTAAEVRT